MGQGMPVVACGSLAPRVMATEIETRANGERKGKGIEGRLVKVAQSRLVDGPRRLFHLLLLEHVPARCHDDHATADLDHWKRDSEEPGGCGFR